ncbi:MAG: hypothetical protein AAF497_20760 [Planctomycetota bacterium]
MEKQLKRLVELSKLDDLADHADEADELIRKSLQSKHQRLICRAAQLTRKRTILDFVDDLLAAYARLLNDPTKSDPGCEAKTAIVEALESARYDNEDFFLTAIKYRQIEPVFGGSVDAAAKLRVHAGFALTELNRLQAVGHLVELLVDPESTARAGACRALATCAEASAKHILRLKVHMGDEDPAVLGECCYSFLSIAGPNGVPIVAEHLRSESRDERMEAAFALGNSRIATALPFLQRQVERTDEWEEAQITLTSIALLQTDEATEYLFSIIEKPSTGNPFGPEAIKALGSVRDRDAIKSRIQTALKAKTNDSLNKAFRETFE